MAKKLGAKKQQNVIVLQTEGCSDSNKFGICNWKWPQDVITTDHHSPQSSSVYVRCSRISSALMQMACGQTARLKMLTNENDVIDHLPALFLH